MTGREKPSGAAYEVSVASSSTLRTEVTYRDPADAKIICDSLRGH
jgi:hypothetical protein